MAEKFIVSFEALPVLPCESDYLTYCMQCGTYNLGRKPCVKCHSTDEVSLDDIAAKTIKKHLSIRLLGMLIGYLALFIAARNLTQIFLATGFVGICIGLNVWIYLHFKESWVREEMSQHIAANQDQMKSDLRKQLAIATEDIEKGKLVQAYDRFRYLGKLMDTEEIRIYKLICLRSFEIRNDMPLEMNSLLLEEYNVHLVQYIYEVAKVKKELIDEATLAYLTKYQEQVLMMRHGKKIMGTTLSACLRSKYLFVKYAAQLPEYLVYFSKPRLVRLCKLSSVLEDSSLRENLLMEAQSIMNG